MVGFLLLVSGIMFACTEKEENTNYSIEFKQQSVVMQIGDQLNISEILTITGANFSDVNFRSSNNSVAFVNSQNKLVAVASGSASIEAKIKQKTTYLSVDVEEQLQPFEVVKNFNWNNNTNTLSWEEPYIRVSSKTIKANSYELEIKKDDEQPQTITLLTNTYKFDQPGNYSVKVKASALGFAPSEYSLPFIFKVVKQPTNLVFDANTNKLSWDAVENATYIVWVNDLSIGVIENYIVLDNLTEPKQYLISVTTNLDEFYSKPTEPIVVTRLNPIDPSVQNGILRWNLSQADITSEYQIKITPSIGDEITISNKDGRYDFSGLPAGEYTVTVQAFGNGINSLSSLNNQSITITKLNPPTLMFDPSTETLSVSSENVKLYINKFGADSVKEIELGSRTEYLFTEGVGIYEIYAYQMPSDDDQIISEKSSSIFIKKLSSLEGLTHQIKDGKSTLSFTTEVVASSYDVFINGSPERVFVEQNQNNVTLTFEQDYESIFSNVGIYEIFVQAYDDQFPTQGPNYFVINNQAKSVSVEVERLGLVNAIFDQSERKIIWDTFTGAVAYKFKIYKNGELINEMQTSQTQFSTSSFDFGNYEFQIKAIGNNSTSLDSLEFSSLHFSIKHQLAKPNLTFDRTTLKLTISKVSYADVYNVYIYNFETSDIELLASLDENSLEFDLTPFLTQIGNYKFFVNASSSTDSADNEGEGNLYSSEFAELTIEKLYAPTSLTVTPTNNLVVDDLTKDPTLSSKLDARQFIITVNGNQVTNLATYSLPEIESFEIKTYFIGRASSTSPYYLDSEQSTFYITRLSVPTNVKFEDYVVSWDENEFAEEYEIILFKGLATYSVKTTSNVYDLNSNTVVKDIINTYGDGFGIQVRNVINSVAVPVNENKNISSLKSQALVINKLETPTFTLVEGTDYDQNQLTVHWNQVEGATSYWVKFDNQEPVNISNTNYTITDTSGSNYVLRVQALSSAHISSNIAELTFVRNQTPSQVSVSKNEVLTVDFDTTKALSALINEDSLNAHPYSLSGITTTKTKIEVRILGKGLVGNVFYMNSNKTHFYFERLAKMAKPVIEEKNINWEIIYNAHEYEVVITNNASQTKVINLPIQSASTQYITNVSIEHPDIALFTQPEGVYTVKIRAVVKDYVLHFGDENVGYLTSEYSDEELLVKLNKVQNVKVLADETEEQINVEISWDPSAYAESYEVYLNRNLFITTSDTSIVTDQLTFDSTFAENGSFTITVIAKATNFISSASSDPITVKRFAPFGEDEVSISEKAILSWKNVANNFGYVIYYKPLGQDAIVPITVNGVVTYNFENQIVNSDIFGAIDFYILVKGNGTNYLSSKYAKITKQKLDEPQLEVFGDGMKVLPSNVDEDAEFEVSVYYKTSTQTYLLISTRLKANQVFEFPDVWYFQGQPLSLLSGGEFVFEARGVLEGYIDSKKVEVVQNKLQAVSFEGFKRQSEHSHLINLVANVGSLKDQENITYTLKISSSTAEGYESYENKTAVPDENGLLTYLIDGQLDYLLGSGEFTLSIVASAPGFINSQKVEISGLRLDPISQLKSQNGILTWNLSAQTQTTNYLLRVVHSDNVFEYIVKPVQEYYDYLQNIDGNVLANVKNIGNITHLAFAKENIVLDSSFRLKMVSPGVYKEDDFTGIKLKTSEMVRVIDGEIAINNVDYAESYEIRNVNSKVQYYFDEFYKDSTAFYGLSSDFYNGNNKLNLGTTYTFEFRAISTAENVLYSDYFGSLSVRIMPNPNTSANNITFEFDDLHLNISILSWIESSNSNYTILLKQTHSNKQSNLITYKQKVTTNQFEFDSDLIEYSSGTYEFSVRVNGTSDLENGYYYLSSAYSPEFVFEKLEEPSVEIKDGRVVWSEVNGANKYYVYYIVKSDDETMTYSKFIIDNKLYGGFADKFYWQLPEGFGDYNKNVSYYIGVRAVSATPEVKRAPSCIDLMYFQVDGKDTEQVQETVKLKPPMEITVQNGSLVWRQSGLNYNFSFNPITMEVELQEATEPFNYSSNVFDLASTKVTLKFVDDNHVERRYTVPAINLFHAEIFNDPFIYPLIKNIINLPENYDFGWPVVDWFANEIGTDMKAGKHHVSIMQNGNDKTWVDSNFNNGFYVYIPHSPASVYISNNILYWDDVVLPSDKTYEAQFKYIIIAEDANKVRRVIHKTNNLSVNLDTLINLENLQEGTERLPDGVQKFYVLVAGDNNYFLNGIPSTPIEATVLPEVSASVHDGVLNWDSVSQTQSYKIEADPNDALYYKQINQITRTWDFDEISATNAAGETLYYKLTVQAIGNGTTVLSGRKTNLGTVVKLATPQVRVEEGIFKWNNIEGNQGYRVVVKQGEEEIYSQQLTINRNYFESTLSGFNNYRFMTLGSTQANLNSESLIYARSSSMINGIDAVMLPSITDVKTKNGHLSWNNIKELDNTDVVSYKISFDDIHYYEPIFVSNLGYVFEGPNVYVTYEIGSNYEQGNYKVYIQAHSTNTYYREVDGKTYYYLLSRITEASSTEFIKLKTVSDVQVIDGVVRWTGNDINSNNYKLTLSSGGQSVEFFVNDTNWDATTLTGADREKYEQIATDKEYLLNIQVLGNDSNLINSDIVQDIGFKKLDTIVPEIEYLLSQKAGGGFVIRWKFTKQIPGISDYHYVFEFDNGNGIQYIDSRLSSLITRGFLPTENYYYGEVESVDVLDINTEVLKFKVAVIPVSLSKILVSNFSSEKQLTPPKSLSGYFGYNANERKITWEYQSIGSEVSFRIVDELVTIDEEYQITVVSSKVYNSQLKEYYPEEIGIHRIKIAVVLSGGNVISSYVYFHQPGEHQGIINHSSFEIENEVSEGEMSKFSLLNFNLFESGDGSKDNPYTISTSTHFANINYRLSKLDYMGGEKVFYFLQTQNLNLNINSPITAFNGVYDGNGKTITWQYTSTSSTLTTVIISLFTQIRPLAIVQNVQINATAIQNNNTSVSNIYLSGLAYENYGKIYNVKLTNFVFKTPITRGINYFYGGFTVFNYGRIERAVSSANLLFDGGTEQQSIRNSVVSVGAIANSNSKTTEGLMDYIGIITESANIANIKVTARTISIGGLVVSTHPEAEIEKSFNLGKINATLTGSGEQTNFIGGLVANSQGVIRNSYNKAENITIDLSGNIRTVYMGGIAGYISGANGALINNSFTTTTSLNVQDGGQSNLQIGLLVGYSTAQDTNYQQTSYYNYSSSLMPINNAPNGFNVATIVSSQNLLNALNANETLFEATAQYPVLIWESDYSFGW